MSRRLPPLGALRAFEAAARHGSFVAAAQELAVTPAAISQQVRLLEDDLGVVLFKRLPRGLILTAAGHAALPDLREAFERLRRGVAAARAGEPRGPLRVSVLSSFCARWLVPRLADFVAAYPEIELRITAESRRTDPAREDVDVAIRYGAGLYPGLRVVRLLTEEVFPVCAPRLLNAERPLTRPDDLRHHTLLHDSEISAAQPWLAWSTWLRDWGLAEDEPTRALRFSDSHQLLACAVMGLGVAIGRSALVADDLAQGTLVRPLRGVRTADYSYWIVTARDAEANPRIAAFTAWLQAQTATSGMLQNPSPRVP